MKNIELKIGDKLAKYDSQEGAVLFTTRHGVEITAKIPENWALTRIMQFMESLIKSDSQIS